MQIDPEGIETKRILEFADFGGTGRQRVLEVGCGDGRLTWRYANAASSVAAIDLEGDQLRIAMADRPGNMADRVNFSRADGTRLPFKSRSFDLAIFAWSF